MNSYFLKNALLSKYRFDLRAEFLATECGVFESDVLLISKQGKLVEIETKVSVSDLRRDFKKKKHALYSVINDVKVRRLRHEFIPNQFFFAVPAEMTDKALQILEEIKGTIFVKYGIWSVDDDGNCNLVRKAKNIHDFEVSDQVKRSLQLRTTSELINLRRMQYGNRFNEIGTSDSASQEVCCTDDGDGEGCASVLQ